jgi:hypothetical protein
MRVRKILADSPQVHDYETATDQSSWGATIAYLTASPSPDPQ